MVTSGVATRKALDLDFEDDSESTVHVMVHDLKPPFLDGRTVFTKQLEPINPIRDPTSDMAIFSKKGSALVKEKREQAERAKAAAKLAALSGTALGNIMGVKDEEAEAEGASSSALRTFFTKLDIHIAIFSSQLRPRNKKKRQKPKGTPTTKATLNSLSTLNRPLESVRSLETEPSNNKESIFQHLLAERNL